MNVHPPWQRRIARHLRQDNKNSLARDGEDGIGG